MAQPENYRYTIYLVIQLCLLMVDLLCNSISVAVSWTSIGLLVLFVFQVLCLLASLVLLFLQFFNTFAFKAGILYVLLRKFAGTILMIFVYMALTIGYGVWNVAIRWDREGQYGWNSALQVVFVLHKLCAIAYYYLYKRSALRLGDVRYYKDSTWIWSQVSK